VVSTDDEQPYSKKQTLQFEKNNQVEPTASFDSPADLAQSELETENPLFNRDFSLNTINQMNQKSRMSR